VLLSSTRKLQAAAQLLQLKTRQDELARRLEHLDDQRKLELFREQQETGVKLGEIRQKLQSVGEKLQYAAMVRSQLVRGSGTKPEIIIFRKSEKGTERLVADEDAELQPGDTAEVSLQYNNHSDAPIPLGAAGNARERNSIQ
jgi:polysaccharide export outer membrane protein